MINIKNQEKMETEIKKFNQEIENRIKMEIVVDAHDESERAMGWYYYLQDKIAVPFKAKCIQPVSTSPLKIGEIVEVVALDNEKNCEYDIFVKIKWKNKETLCVPMKQLKGINIRGTTEQALNDWAYWISQGYCF